MLILSKLPFLKKKKSVVFIYADRYKFSGSTIMRGEQLSKILAKQFSNEYRVVYESLAFRPKDSFIFLTKGAVTDITIDQITELKNNGNIVVLDPVDNPVDLSKAEATHGVIAASKAAHAEYLSKSLKSFLVNHHVDPRLIKGENSKANTFKAGYFGELINTIQSDKISEFVDFVHIDTGKQTNDWFAKPIQYNMHYAVRSNNTEAPKPFLKGFTAAACGANIIIQRSQKEAVNWLGEDYPYLLSEDSGEQEIIDMLTYARDTYDTEVWNNAQATMQQISIEVSDVNVANQLHYTIQELS